MPNLKLLILVLTFWLMFLNIVLTQKDDVQVEDDVETISNNNESNQQGNSELNFNILQAGNSSRNHVNDTSNSTSTTIKQRINCIPVFRDETNKTGKIIVLNHSNLGDYLQLTNLPFSGAKIELDNVSTSSLNDNENNSTEQEFAINIFANDSAKSEPGECSVIVFYLPTCPFSVAATPHFNAMARLFPQVNVLAIDAYGLYSATIRFGVVGVPSVFFYHKSRLVSWFSKAEPRLKNLAEYFKKLADLEPIGPLEIQPEDESDSPLPTKVEASSNLLYYAAISFIVLVCIHNFALSEMCKNAVTFIRNKWTALLFHHEHLD